MAKHGDMGETGETMAGVAGSDLSNIFESREVLEASYIPNELPYREPQTERMASVLVSALRGDVSSNILLHGRRGTGKTTTARYVGHELESAGRRFGSDCEVKYINCKEVDTCHRVLTRLAQLLGRVEVPERGWPTDRVYDAVVDGTELHGRVVVVLDEVDNLVEKSGDGVLYSLSRMNRDLDEARVSLISISDDASFTDLVSPRVKSSLGEEVVYFPSYTAEQLREVLRPRAEAGFVDGAVGDEVVPACAAFAAMEGGDARCALDLLRCAGETADRSGKEKVRREDVRSARDKLGLG